MQVRWQQVLQGYVDPSGQSLKNTASVATQIKELALNVPWPIRHSPSNQTLKEFTVEMGPNSVTNSSNATAATSAGVTNRGTLP